MSVYELKNDNNVEGMTKEDLCLLIRVFSFETHLHEINLISMLKPSLSCIRLLHRPWFRPKVLVL